MRKNTKKIRRKIIIYDLLILIIVIAIIIVGYKLISYYAGNAKSQDKIQSLKTLINTTEEDKDDASKSNNEKPENKYKKLYEKNSDFIGWLSIEDTVIDYPVMQNMEDNEYYLHRDFNKEYDYSGMIFADNRCSIEKASSNIILYGHHMKTGRMFASIVKYREQSYLDNHKIIRFDTIYGERMYEVFAAFNAQVYDKDDTEHFKYYNFINVSDEQEYNEVLDTIKSMSFYKDNIPKYGEEILTLSTCNGDDEVSRFVVMAKRIK